VKILLTGLPGSGKSTVLMRVVNDLTSKGLRVGGIITPETRVHGRRTGFRIVDLYAGREAVLASSEARTGPQLGRYRVDVDAFEAIALPALDYAEKQCDLVCIDEIGKMEFFSKRFVEKINALFESEKPMIAVVHRDFVRLYGKYGTLITVTLGNRDHLVTEIPALILKNRRKGQGTC